MERLHAGWLVKSPPGKKTIGPWRLFKSKWRERYFVLYAPPSSQTIPGCCSAVLCYYDDENLVKEYGRIDLSRCEEILTQLESDEYHHIFALRTVNKDHERTYYLAANSNEEMNQWANCLCCVLRLSGGDGFNLSSGFESLFPLGETLLSPSRCSILTQRSGEQRRMSNVPETISKSASALNIRMAEASQTNSQNSLSNPNPSNGRMGKRQSILSMVVKPAVSTLRRPSCPAVAQNSVQKCQTVGRTTGLKLSSQSFLTHNVASTPDFHQQTLTLGRPVPKLNFLPPTPSVSYGTASNGPDFAAGGSNGHDYRWRFDEAATPRVVGLDDRSQGPPLPPNRVLRSASKVEHNHYRNSSEDFHWSKERSRASGQIEEDSDEGSFDPDYVLPRPVYDNESSNGNHDQGGEFKEEEPTEAPEEDREDDYSYPPFHYSLISAADESQTSPSLPIGDGEGERCEDSYDYLPGCSSSSSRAPSDRMSVTRSSTYTNNSDNNTDGLYDILPLRNYDSEETTSAARMSGVESPDQGSIYQNEASRRPSNDTSPNPTVIPPLPEKTGCKEETTPREKRPVPRPPSPPPLPPPSSADHLSSVGPCYINNVDVLKTQSEGSCYINNIDVMKTQKERSRSFEDEDVYLPMNKSRVSDSIYTPMHSPEVDQIFKDSSVDGTDCTGDFAGDWPSPFHCSQFTGKPTNDENFHSGSFVPIRFTNNTRSFKRKAPNRESLNSKVEMSTTSSRQREYPKSSEVTSCPPTLPPKKSAANNPNYIHYASLNLDSTVEKLPSPLSSPTSPGAGGGFQSDTLYRQIDPEKTKALCELKKQMDDRQRNFPKFAPEY